MQKVQNQYRMDLRKYFKSFNKSLSQTNIINKFISKQVFAYEESEKYKEGKYIIERFYLAKKTEPKYDKDKDDN